LTQAATAFASGKSNVAMMPSPRKDEIGILMRAFAIMVEKRQRAENKLRWKKALLEAHLNSSIDGIVVVDQHGRRLYQNRQLAHMLAIPQHILDVENDGEQLKWLLGLTKDPVSFTEKVAHLLAHPNETSRDQIDLKNGTILDRYSAPVIGEDGEYFGRLWNFHDVTAYKQTEAALQRQQTELRALIDLVPAMICVKDTHNKILRANQRVADQLGKRVEEIEGNSTEEVFPDRAANFYADDLSVIRSGVPKLGIVELLPDKRGDERWVQRDIVPYRDRDKKVVGLVVMVQDITDRMRDQEVLRESQRFLQSTLDALSAHIAILDEHAIIVKVNAAWNRFASANGFVGNNGVGESYLHVCSSAFGPWSDEASAVAAGIRAVMCGTVGEFKLEYSCHSPKEQRWFILTATRFGGDGPVRVVVAHEDITARKRGEETLLLLSSAVGQVNESIVITDAQLDPPGPRILFVNAAFTSMTGYTAADVLGMTPRISLGGPGASAAMNRLCQTLAEGGTFSDESVNYRKDGSLYNAEFHVSPIRDARGVVTNFVAIHRDVSAARALKAEVETSRLKSRFLANMSHELRTPLNTINGLSATLLEQEMPAHDRHAVSLILQCGESLLENIQTILTHSSLEAGKTKLDCKPFVLLPVLLNALHIAGSAVHEKPIDIDYDVEPSTPSEWLGDAFRLQQILVNLLANAIKFTDRGRVHLRVRARRMIGDNWELRFAIADTGIGIAQRNIDKLFKPFSQADDSDTRRFEGTGLGLAIAKSLVELMGGYITVNSRPGIGSLFRIAVALPSVPGTPTVFTARLRPELAGKHVHIVEPDAMRRRQLLALAEAWRLHATIDCSPLQANPAPSPRYDILLRRFLPSTISTEPPTDKPVPIVWLVPQGCVPPAIVPGQSTVVYIPFGADELGDAIVSLLNPAPHVAPAATNTGKQMKLGERLPLRILSADDVRTNREVLRIMCRHLGYTTDLVENGAEVLEQLAANSYDLVLLDVQMPVMDGLSAAQEICRLYPDPERRPRLVAVTAGVQPGDRERCLAAGMDDFLSKPLLPKTLQACIERLFGGAAVVVPRGSASPLRPVTEPNQWIDYTQLKQTTEDLENDAAADLVVQLFTASKADFDALRPRIAEACALCQVQQLSLCVHGLKGCVLSLGWTHMGSRCIEAHQALKENRFEAWAELPRELDELFRLSTAELEKALVTLFGRERNLNRSKTGAEC